MMGTGFANSVLPFGRKLSRAVRYSAFTPGGGHVMKTEYIIAALMLAILVAGLVSLVVLNRKPKS
jgi:hypothetical protein